VKCFKKWNALKRALREGAEAELGYVKSKQSDWFRDSTAKLTPLLERRNKLYNLWLNIGKE